MLRSFDCPWEVFIGVLRIEWTWKEWSILKNKMLYFGCNDVFLGLYYNWIKKTYFNYIYVYWQKIGINTLFFSLWVLYVTSVLFVFQGYHGDTSKTFVCGNVDERTKRLVKVLFWSIAQISYIIIVCVVILCFKCYWHANFLCLIQTNF